MNRPEPRPPRTFFPTAINVYRQCPERYFRQYVLKQKRPQPFSRAMVIGGATHRLIGKVLPDYMRTGKLPVGLLDQAFDEIRTADYPPEERESWEQDAKDTVEHTLTALDMIPEESSSLLQERRLYAPLGRSGVEIGSQVDLVLQRPGGELEHVDFKTGRIGDNTVQALMTRAVVGRRFGNVRRILSSTWYLQHRESHTIEFDRKESEADWRSIARDIRQIRSLGHFPPNRGPLCDYCPFQARDCTVW